MPAERCRVGMIINGADQFYQRDREEKRDGRWVAIPYFVLDRREAITMSEAQARVFLNKLRSLGVTSAWIEDARDARRIDVPQETVQSGDDNRQPLIGTLNDVDWYIIKPICRPEGRKWFLRIDVPGLPDPQVIYADDPLGVLQRAEDMNFLRFAPKYVRPEPQQPATPKGPRKRPGDMR